MASWPPMVPAGTAVAVCASTPSPNSMSRVVPANSADSSGTEADTRMLSHLRPLGGEAQPGVHRAHSPGDRLGRQVDVLPRRGVVRDGGAQHRRAAPAGPAQDSGAV